MKRNEEKHLSKNQAEVKMDKSEGTEMTATF